MSSPFPVGTPLDHIWFWGWVQVATGFMGYLPIFISCTSLSDMYIIFVTTYQYPLKGRLILKVTDLWLGKRGVWPMSLWFTSGWISSAQPFNHLHWLSLSVSTKTSAYFSFKSAVKTCLSHFCLVKLSTMKVKKQTFVKPASSSCVHLEKVVWAIDHWLGMELKIYLFVS